MRYWIYASAFVTVVVVLMVLFGCASGPLTEEQRMARMRLAVQLLTPPPSNMQPLTIEQGPTHCTTTVYGNIANTTCR